MFSSLENQVRMTKTRMSRVTHCTASGDPVRERLLSGRPTLSVRQNVTFHSKCTIARWGETDRSRAVHPPCAIWTLQPESCCILLICSPPRPMTVENSRRDVLNSAWTNATRSPVLGLVKLDVCVYSLRPTMASGTLYSSVIVEDLMLERDMKWRQWL